MPVQTLDKDRASMPTPSALAAKPVLFSTLLVRMSRVHDGRVQGHLALRQADTSAPGPYGQARVVVPAHTRCDINLVVDRSGPKSRIEDGSVRFSRPLTIANPIHAWVAPKGVMRLVRPLLDWSLRYDLRGISYADGGMQGVDGDVRFLGFKLKRISRRVSEEMRRKADKVRNMPHGQRLPKSAKKPMQNMAAVLVPQIVRKAAFKAHADGCFPDPLHAQTGHTVLTLPGGAYGCELWMDARINRHGQAAVQVRAQPLLNSQALALGLTCTADARVYTDAQHTLHVDAQGAGHLASPNLQFALRPDDAPPGSGIRIIAGACRSAVPGTVAMRAPFSYTLRDRVFTVEGCTYLTASAFFLTAGETPPALADERASLDLQGNLKFRLYNTVAKAMPQLYANGTVAMTPQGTQPFEYTLDMSPTATRFEPIEGS